MPLGAATGLVAALHDLHGEWDLIFSNPPWVARPLHTLCPLVTTSVMRAFDTQHIVLIYCVQVPMTCPGLPLQLLWRTLTDERLDLCEVCGDSVPVCGDIVHSDVTWAWTPRWPVATSCVVKISSFVAQSYGHGVLVPPWCPHGSTVRCGHPSGPAHDVGTSGSMVRDPQPAHTCTVIRVH
jgi:hypothetical protein